MFTIKTSSPEETANFAKLIAKHIPTQLCLCLQGDLGAGKTLFTQAFAKALGVEEPVTSPTFNLMNVYKGDKTIYHFDLYRLANEEELYDIGFYEYTQLDADEIALIEWPDNFWECMPEDYLKMQISLGENSQERVITLENHGQFYADFYKELKNQCQS